MLKNWLRWADALVITERELLVVEAGILPDLGDPSKVEGYLYLVGRTEELRPYHHLPRRGVLVYPYDDPLVHRLARERGIAVELFKPPWVADYLAGRLPRHRRPPLSH